MEFNDFANKKVRQKKRAFLFATNTERYSHIKKLERVDEKMSRVRMSFSKAEIDLMLDILRHVKDHSLWMTEVFENGEKLYSAYEKFYQAKDKHGPGKNKLELFLNIIKKQVPLNRYFTIKGYNKNYFHPSARLRWD